MNRRFAIHLWAVALLAAAIPARADDEAARESIRQLATAFETAINSGALESVAPLLAPDATAVMMTGEEIRGFDEWQTWWSKMRESLGAGGAARIALNTGPVDLLGEAAFAHGTADQAIRTGAGREFHFRSPWTAVCRKHEGKWKIVRLHVSINPVQNGIVTAQLKTTRGIFAVGGLLSGGLIMWIVCSARRPRTGNPTPTQSKLPASGIVPP